MIGKQQQRNTSSIIIKPNVSDLAISKMQNITPIMKSPYKLMIFLLCLVLFKKNGEEHKGGCGLRLVEFVLNSLFSTYIITLN